MRPPTTSRKPTRWYADKKNNRRTPDLLPRDEVARAINSEVKAGRGSPHGGVFLDIASRRPADYIRKRLPSMYHQFKELAGVDITKEAMEVGPTCHYLNGGLRVEADSAATRVAGLFAAGEVAGGLHGANRLGGNSLSDLVVFGRRAGLYAAEYVKSLKGQVALDAGQVETRRPHAPLPLPEQGPARTRTRSTPTCRSACSRSSASSGPRASCARLSRRSRSSGSASRAPR